MNLSKTKNLQQEYKNHIKDKWIYQKLRTYNGNRV